VRLFKKTAIAHKYDKTPKKTVPRIISRFFNPGRAENALSPQFPGNLTMSWFFLLLFGLTKAVTSPINNDQNHRI